MANLRMAEVFGRKVEDRSAEAEDVRRRKWCPFQDKPCSKDSARDPLGVCSLVDEGQLVVTCPKRFLERGVIFRDAAAFAFGPGESTAVVPEVPFLRSMAGTRKLGKIDYVIAKHAAGQLLDFCALEVQAVYMSGTSMRPEFRRYLETGEVQEAEGERHADYRSSSHKRLMPQLMIKVPALRRWGKKVLVAIHADFFEWLPDCAVVDESNAELTWLVYQAQNRGNAYELTLARTVATTLDDAVLSLTAAVPPPRHEFEEQLQAALDEKLNGNGPVAR